MFSDEDIKEILNKYKLVAVVGLSRNPSKDSHDVADYLQSVGYRIIPINPVAKQILGEISYGSLLDLPKELKREIEIVNIFRPSESVPQIVDESIELKKEFGTPKVIWMQLGIINEKAAEKAMSVGMKIVMDRCMKVEHYRLFQERVKE
jgi:predicted CoA-binding protein